MHFTLLDMLGHLWDNLGITLNTMLNMVSMHADKAALQPHHARHHGGHNKQWVR
jgi:hypothetical protein